MSYFPTEPDLLCPRIASLNTDKLPEETGRGAAY